MGEGRERKEKQSRVLGRDIQREGPDTAVIGSAPITSAASPRRL